MSDFELCLVLLLTKLNEMSNESTLITGLDARSGDIVKCRPHVHNSQNLGVIN